MQQASRGPPRALVSPLPSPTISHADSNFSVSRYATQTTQNSAQTMAPPLQRMAALPGQPALPSGYPSDIPRSNGSNPDSHRSVGTAHAHERVVRQHWEAFRDFLNSGENHVHPRQNKAREKLTRLSETQFHELSTDVYDEVLRRSSRSSSSQSFLPPNPSFHPKRNQAREKLASLQTSRFKDLAADVFFEIERRFPGILRASQPSRFDGSDRSSPAPTNQSHVRGTSNASSQNDDRSLGSRQLNVFRQTAVIPMKSTMIEEDEDSDSGSDLKSPKNESDQSSLRSSGLRSNSITNRTRSPRTSKDVMNDYDSQRVNELLTRIKTLEDELERQTNENTSSRQLRRDMEIASERNDKLEEDLATLRLTTKQKEASGDHASLVQANAQLKEQLAEQQRISEDVHQEAEGFLREMRELSERESTIYEQAENLQAQVTHLENEVTEWKDKYLKVKTQLRQLKATSQFFSPNPDFKAGTEGSFVTPNGIVQDIAITKFQESIDSLLRIARTNTVEITESMREVIMSVRGIQKDLDESSSPLLRDDRFNKLRQRMSNTTNNLMTACKNHANGGSLSPVSLVDAAASHLASTVIEIVKICKLKTSTIDAAAADDDAERGEQRSIVPDTKVDLRFQDDYQAAPRETNGHVDPRRQASRTFQPPAVQANESVDSARDINAELRDFLGGQTEGIVAAIQRLLSAIRSDAKTPVLQTYMGDIVTIVTKVTSNMREAFQDSRPLRASAGAVVEALENCTSRIRDMENVAARASEQQASKEFKQRLAGIAFDTAKQTKELSIVLQGEAEDEDEVDLT